MFNFANSIKILSLIFVFFLLNILCLAQEKVELEVTGRSSVETIKGGEKFSYTFTIRNLSAETAKDVHLMHDLERSVTFVSAGVSQGTYTNDDERSNSYPKVFRAQFGDLQGYAEVTVTIEVKVDDWGNEDIFPPEASINKSVLSNFPTAPLGEPNSKTENTNDKTGETGPMLDIYYPDVHCDNCAQHDTNIRQKISVTLLPSKNIPPRIEILSPKNEASFTKPLNKQIEVPIVIKAFDTDGKIAKVLVDDNSKVQIIFEDGQYKYIIGGRKVATKEEAEEMEKDEAFLKSLETPAVLTGKDTYTFVVKNFHYGPNRIHIQAIDDGGRASWHTLNLNIKRDATVEVVSPKDEQVFTPNSTITVETISEINDSTTFQLRINVTQNDYFSSDASFSLLRQISKAGNAYKHQYVWKNVPEGVYRLSVMLADGDVPSLYVDHVTVVVAEPRRIKIFSLKNNQEFNWGEPIKVSIDATDIKGRVVRDQFELLVDGKNKGTMYNSWQNSPVPPYTDFVLNKDYGFNLFGLEKGIHTIQVIARRDNFSREGAILGQSEIITIKVK